MKSKARNVLLIVVDAVGVSTLEYLLSKYEKPVHLPNLSKMGLGGLLDPRYAKRLGKADGKSYALRLEQASASADSVIGHREMAGIVDHRTYNLFPEGFRADYIAELEKRIGRKTMFNKMAGGMEAIELNAEEHARSGRPIVYASKCDPLIQLAMDENIIPVPEQHKIADTAFDLAMEMKIPVTRAIARAYVRTPEGEIVRTPNRHDAVLPMDGRVLPDMLKDMGVWTVAVGKTSELVNTVYNEKIKLTRPEFIDPALKLRFVHPKGKDTNPFSVQGIVNALDAARAVYRPHGTFIFANLVDTDSLYGHTRDVPGALKSLEEFDRVLPLIEKHMASGDLMLITADHGMAHRDDYGYHNREPLALLARVKGKRGLDGLKAPSGKTLADTGYLAAQVFGCEKEFAGSGELKRFFPA